MMNDRCHKCKHYILEFSPIYKSYIEGCSALKMDRNDGCKYAFELKEKPKAIIKRRV